MDKGHPVGRVVKLPMTHPASRDLESGNSAHVVEVIAPGRYSIALPAGGEIEVEGEAGLKVGTPVRVLQSSVVSSSGAVEGPGFPWRALIPLDFGGKNASAELKVYVEKIGESIPAGAKPAIYLIMEYVTELQKKSQWSIYLRGNSVAIQVYPGDEVEAGEGFLSLVREVEQNLKRKGFFLTGPSVILKKRFSIPRGFHLNIKG